MDIDHHIIPDTSSLLDALSRLNDLSGAAMTLLVVDGDGCMAGTLTDGDVRRALLRGLQPTAGVSDAMRRDFRSLDAANPSVEQMKTMRRQGVRLIPLLDAEGRIVRVIDTAVTHTLLPLKALVMAGGKGERLRPLTLDTPKPLLTVGGKPIIDYTIQMLHAAGIHDVTVSVNYMAEQIKRHFKGTEVKCLDEAIPMGTVGPAALMAHEPKGATLVMNSDLLTSLSLEDLYLTHLNERADITIAAIPYNVSVPYAILTTKGGLVTGLEEKPTYSHYANAGIYVINNNLLAALPRDRRTDATDLIADAISRGKRVAYYPINGTWIDIGTPADYRHACELMQFRE